MNGYQLTLESDQDDRAVWLITASQSGMRQREILWLREGFGLDDVREAIMATGCVKEEGHELRFTTAGDGLCGNTLSNLVEEIFSYFNAPGVPTSELLEVQSAVGQYEALRNSNVDVPLYAYAWLDLVVREDIADEARSAKGIWAKSNIAIELDRCCANRVAELLSRYSQLPARAPGRLAGSISTRTRDASRDTKTG